MNQVTAAKAEHEHGWRGPWPHAAHDHGGYCARVMPLTPLTRAIKFLPLLWTIFFFVLGCNLMGMVPWAGAPTAALAVTLALACVTFVTVVVAGMMQFGVGGYFPESDSAAWIASATAAVDHGDCSSCCSSHDSHHRMSAACCIKHGVLAVRLLANMVAGHLVMLGIMGLAFGAEAAIKFSRRSRLAMGRDGIDRGCRVGRFQMFGIVRCLPAGVHHHLSVRTFHRRGDPQALTPTHYRSTRSLTPFPLGDRIREQVRPPIPRRAW